MPFITWNDNFDVGIKKINEQHKKIIELINRMYDAMKSGRGLEIVKPVLGELTAYTQYHFDDEERLFKQYGYPETEKHTAQHDELIKRVKELSDQARNETFFLSIQVMDLLNRWITHHILDSDKRYEDFFKEIEWE